MIPHKNGGARGAGKSLARLSKKVCAPADPRVYIAQAEGGLLPASFVERYKF